MKESDRTTFLKALTATFETYGRPLPSRVALEMWWTILEPYEIQSVKAALHAHMRDPVDGRFPPCPPNIIAKLEIAQGDRATLAWGDAMAELKLHGRRSAHSPNSVTECTVKALGGWEALGLADPCHLARLRRDFESTFPVFDRRAKREALAKLESADQIQLGKFRDEE